MILKGNNLCIVYLPRVFSELKILVHHNKGPKKKYADLCRSGKPATGMTEFTSGVGKP